MSRTRWWSPDAFARRRPFLDIRGRVLEATRAFFRARGFAEVETPALQACGGMEPHLVPFATALAAPGGQAMRAMELHTSPEFAMKKLLVAGSGPIFQLARVFRNEERSATHHPEFTMLEWYRPERDLGAIEADCAGLLAAALAASGRPHFVWRGTTAALSRGIERLSVQEAFLRHAGIDVLATAPDPHAPSSPLLAEAMRRSGLEPHPGDGWDDLFFRVFLERVEPHLGVGRPTVLADWPISMAALSRPNPDDPRLCERFELFVCGLELANAFGELTDSQEQRRRFERDRALRRARYGRDAAPDADFLAALDHGLPPSCGIALGFDRLAMLAAGAERIEDVLWAPVAAPEGE